MKWRQDRQRGDFGADPLGQADAVLDGFACEFGPVRRDQDVGIHRYFIASASNLTSRAARRSIAIRDGDLYSFSGKTF